MKVFSKVRGGILWAVLLAGPVMAQHSLLVVDGFDSADPFAQTISFNRNRLSSPRWQLRYFSGRHLRVVGQENTVFTETVANMLDNAFDPVRLVDITNRGNTLPWVASYATRLNQVILRRMTFVPRAGDVPDIQTRVFDAISNGSYKPRDLEWAAGIFESEPNRTTVVHYHYNGFWRADTLDRVPGRLSGESLRFFQHGSGVKSIATVSDSLFRVRVRREGVWQPFETRLHETHAWLLGGTLPDGVPIWLFGRHLVRLVADTLQVEEAPLDSGLTQVVDLDLFIQDNGALHLLYHVRQPNFVRALLHLQKLDGVWQQEVVLEGLSFNTTAAITASKDTLLVALGNPNAERIVLFKKLGDTWVKTGVADRSGDMGMELAVALDPSRETGIAYYDATNRDLKFARNDRYLFDTPFRVETVDSSGNVGRYPKVVLATDTAHVVYFDEDRGLLKHALQTRSSTGAWEAWQVTTLDTLSALEVPFGLTGETGQPEVAYKKMLAGVIKYARFSDGQWLKEVVTPAKLEPPGQLTVFRAADSVYVGYVENGRLHLAVREGPDDWRAEMLPVDQTATFAEWTADFDGNVNVVYRVPRGFSDEIRHAQRVGGMWSDQPVTTTSTNGTFLRLKRSDAFSRSVVLAFYDDARARTFCYVNGGWHKAVEARRLMADTMLDLTATDFFTLTLFYRTPLEQPVPYRPEPFAELVADVVEAIVDDVNPTQPVVTRSVSLTPYPNPFNAQTTIAYTVPRAGSVHLDVYNLAGQKVRKLVDGVQPSGDYEVSFRGDDLASGLYFCRYEISGQKGTIKMTLVK